MASRDVSRDNVLDSDVSTTSEAMFTDEIMATLEQKRRDIPRMYCHPFPLMRSLIKFLKKLQKSNLFRCWYHYLPVDYYLRIQTSECKIFLVDIGGLGTMYWPCDLRFAVSNTPNIDGLFKGVKFLRKEFTLWIPNVRIFSFVKEPQPWKNRALTRIYFGIHVL